MRHTFLAISAGLFSGILILASLSGASIAVAYLTLVLPLPMLMAGLGLGTRGALIAVSTGLIITALANPVSGLAFAMMFGLPVWLIVRMALTGPKGPVVQAPEHEGPYEQEGLQTQSTFQDRILGRAADWEGEIGQPQRDADWFPAGHITAVITVLAGIYLIASAIMASGDGGLQQVVTAYLTKVAEVIAGTQGQEVLRDAILLAVPFFPGSVAAFWVLSLLVNTIIAQALLAKGGRNLRPSPRLRELLLPDWLSWALVLAALIALISSGEMEYIGRNLALTLAVPFFFLGLSVVHKLAAHTPLPGALLALVYMVTIFSGWFALIIAGLGVLEQWVGLKDRMDTPTDV